jgi:hypothetical protein
MHSLIDFHSFGGIVRIDNSIFENFHKCGAIIANKFYPDYEIIRNLQINSSEFGEDLNISFDEEHYVTILSEFADILASKEADFEGFSNCEEDESADPTFQTCFQIEVTNSEFIKLNQNLNQMKAAFGKTGKDLADSITPQFLGYFLSLHQYKGSLLIQNNQFL